MAAIATNTLLDEAKCYACYGSATIPQLIKLALLRRIVLSRNSSADVSAAGLLDYAKCYGCFGANVFDLLELALLDLLAQS